MARRYDPERRSRIIDAAIRVVGERGIAGLSHRSVAAEADVPLGSTTYHFASLDELLTAALRRTNENFAAVMRGSTALADPDADLAAELARLLGRYFAAGRGRAELEYELYLAALRRPALRPVAAEWTDATAALLQPCTGPATARALVALMDGICLQVLLTGGEYDEAYAREMLGRVLGRGAEPRPDGETGSPGRGRSG